MKRTDLRKYTHKVKVEFKNFDDFYVVVREPTTIGYIELNKAHKSSEERAVVDCLASIFPEFIVEHNLFEDDGTLSSNEEVINLITKDMAMFPIFMEKISEMMNPKSDVKKRSE